MCCEQSFVLKLDYFDSLWTCGFVVQQVVQQIQTHMEDVTFICYSPIR